MGEVSMTPVLTSQSMNWLTTLRVLVMVMLDLVLPDTVCMTPSLFRKLPIKGLVIFMIAFSGPKCSRKISMSLP